MNRHKGRKGVCFFTFGVLWLSASWFAVSCCAAPLEKYKPLKKNQQVFTVWFKQNVTTKGNALLLKDVADVTPSYAGALSLGDIPLPGSKRVIEKEGVLSLLKKNYGATIKVFFKGESRAVVTTEAFSLTKEKVENFLRKSLSQMFQKDEADVQVQLVSFPPAVLLPSEQYELALPVKKLKLASFLAVPVEIFMDGSVYRRFVCGVKLSAYGKVFVLTRDFGKGEMFNADAVVEGTDDLAKLPPDLVNDPSSLAGKAAKDNVAAGSVLRASAFDFPKVVHQGAELEILAKLGTVTVTAKGKALQDGKIGDVIRVENVDSRKFVHAKVISSGSVEVVLED